MLSRLIISILTTIIIYLSCLNTWVFSNTPPPLYTDLPTARRGYFVFFVLVLFLFVFLSLFFLFYFCFSLKTKKRKNTYEICFKRIWNYRKKTVFNNFYTNKKYNMSGWKVLFSSVQEHLKKNRQTHFQFIT